MERKIEVTPEVREQLKQEFEIKNDTTIYYALKYETNSPSAKMIRRRALELGGVVWQTVEPTVEEGGAE